MVTIKINRFWNFMKALSLLALLLTSLVACAPSSLDKKREGREKKDSARGEDKFNPPNKINRKDLLNKLKDIRKNCAHYDSGAISFTTKALQNCMAKAVDEGLKPLCKQENETKQLVEYYKKTGEEEKEETAREYLLELEEAKYDIMDELYATADEFDELHAELEDEIEGIGGEDKSHLGKVLISSLKIAARFELSGFRSILNSRARLACKGQWIASERKAIRK